MAAATPALATVNIRDHLLLVAAVLLVASWLAPAVQAQSTDPFVLLSVSGDAQATGLNKIFPKRFVVRLTDGSGVPLEGGHVYFENAPCIRLMGSPCEFPAASGHFESGSDNATAPTDATGLAVSPAYYAGSSLGLPGSGTDNLGAIGVSAYVIPDEAPYFFSVSVTLTHYVVFRLIEVPMAQVPAAIPSSSDLSLTAICLLLTICGVARLRTRNTVANRSLKRTAADQLQ